MTRWLYRLTTMTLGAVAVAAASTACSHSSTTEPATGGGGGSGSHGRLVDTFAFNIAGTDTPWTIGVGDIATYLFGASHVSARGRLAAYPPSQIRPRLLLDTITVNDTISGPPFGANLVRPSFLAFDGNGNLWMSVGGRHDSGSVIEYVRSQISQNGRQTPMVTLSGLHAPRGLTFDAQGALLVVDSSAAALLEYTGIELTTSGPPADTISLGGITAAGATWSPVGVAVDQQGDVWVSAVPRILPPGPAADSVPRYVVAKFTPAALQGGGTPAPALTLVQTGSHPAGYGPGMAFDSAGDLWTANATANSVTQFTAASLTAGANPSPSVTITGETLAGIADIAIDPGDILYVGGNAYGTPGMGMFAYRLSQLTVSGSPNPVLSFMPPKGLNHFAIR